MRQTYAHIFSWVMLVTAVILMNFAFAYGGTTEKDTIFLHSKKSRAKPSYFKNGLPFALPPVKPGITSFVKFNVARADDKLLSDVQVYPNPINPLTDPLNLTYVLSRNSNVSIKVMDVLGNNILTVFSQRVDLGEQRFSYTLNNKLTRGFYFVRIAAGTESVIKRISVL